MKIRLAMFALLPLFVIAAGCHGQVPASKGSTVVLTWTAPAGCTTNCTYILSRATGTTCPATTGTNYTPLNQSSPASATTYTDSAPPQGVSVCYVAQTVQGGLTSVASGPSNGGVPIAIPSLPSAPGSLNGTQQSAMLAPPLVRQALPVVASDKVPVAGQLMARVVLP